MERAARAFVACLLGALAGCTSDDTGSPAPSTPAPVERWAANAQDERERYLRAGARIDPALGEPGLLKVGPTICRGMFELRTDDQLIRIARAETSELLGAELTPTQAADLLLATNNFVCPDLER